MSAAPTCRRTLTPNTAPTMPAIAKRTSPPDTNSGPLSFTVGDAQTPAGSLTLTGGSSNTTLVPLGGISFGGTGANRTVTVTPAAGQSGTATITVTVTDAGGLTASDTFLLTVTPNTPPTITDIANLTIPPATNTWPLSLHDALPLSPAGTLALTGGSSNPTLVPLGNIAFGGSGANRTVTVTPAAGQSGTATITVTVTDA